MTSPRPILTAKQMRSAEQNAIEAGTSVEELMERAGSALAEAVYRFAGPLPALSWLGRAIMVVTVMSQQGACRTRSSGASCSAWRSQEQRCKTSALGMDGR